MALPSSAMYTALCVLPTCLGFWKSEYGVSYAYGVSLALVASHALFIGEPLTSTVAVAHATLLLCYGVRLCLFLLYRELTIPYFREFKEKIEERAKARGSRLSRTPFVLGCSFLYAGLAAPMILTASADPSPITCYLLGVAFVGWALAAVGDAQKTIFKARLGGAEPPSAPGGTLHRRGGIRGVESRLLGGNHLTSEENGRSGTG
ncbi:hypothetical protein CYMTET_9526 [Cymbomonas tetramitiformis]|uniref:Uncharacterized protein n=1 Tax=Cymbomonas tetramitiformis TaxID=36881 RepID=A0AAE0GQX2_9CHLO|nr:hypothetical protein CYMTET_9526 [Cymbomonas tetramitiformis]